MTSLMQYLTDYRAFATPEKVGLGDGHVVQVGNVRVKMVFKVSDSKKSRTVQCTLCTQTGV